MSQPPIHIKIAVGQDHLDQATNSSVCLHFKTGVNGAKVTLEKANQISGGKAAEKQITIVLGVEGDGASVASALEAQVNKTTDIQSPSLGQLGNILNMIKGSVQKTISGSGNNVVLQIHPEQSVSQSIENLVGQAQAMAGPLLEHMNTVDFSAQLHHSFGEIVTNKTLPLQKVLEGFSVELSLNVLKEFRKQAIQMFGEIIPSSLKLIQGPAQIFNNVNFEVDFSSFTELPQNLKDLTSQVGKTFLEKRELLRGNFSMMAQGEDLEFIKFLAQNLNGKVHIFVVAPVGGLEVCINLPGFSQLFPL